MDYDSYYAQHAEAFGDAPDRVLVDFQEELGQQARILDVGAGQGRHAIWAATRGHRVVALEPSEVGAAEIEARARELALDIEVRRESFDEFTSQEGSFDAVLVFGLIPDLGPAGVDALVEAIWGWLRSGGLVWLTGFTTEDPAYEIHAEALEAIGARSFRRPDGGVRTYLAPGEILHRFAGFDVVHHWEGLGPEHRHGDGPIERHGRFEAVLRAPECHRAAPRHQS